MNPGALLANTEECVQQQTLVTYNEKKQWDMTPDSTGGLGMRAVSSCRGIHLIAHDEWDHADAKPEVEEAMAEVALRSCETRVGWKIVGSMRAAEARDDAGQGLSMC